jgi:hypothetical protein
MRMLFNKQKLRKRSLGLSVRVLGMYEY